MLLGKRNEKQAESTAHEVDALIGGVVIAEQVIARVRTETCPLLWKESLLIRLPSCGGMGFSHLAAASKRTQSTESRG